MYATTSCKSCEILEIFVLFSCGLYTRSLLRGSCWSNPMWIRVSIQQPRRCSHVLELNVKSVAPLVVKAVIIVCVVVKTAAWKIACVRLPGKRAACLIRTGSGKVEMVRDDDTRRQKSNLLCVLLCHCV